MCITDIKFRKIFPSGKLRAIVSVTFDDLFVVHDIKIIESQNGFFIAMPNRKTVKGEFKDICHPINSQARNMLESNILEAFQQLIDEMETDKPSPESAVVVGMDENEESGEEDE